MLAALRELDWERLYPQEALQQLTPHTLATRTVLRHALAVVRRRGYAFDEQESELGVWAVAAAIRDMQGAPVGALSIFVPLFRVGRKQRLAWGKLVQGVATVVSAALGYPPSPNPVRRRAAVKQLETAP
jgi:DNA-binding IclR family transcriptional regulator